MKRLVTFLLFLTVTASASAVPKQAEIEKSYLSSYDYERAGKYRKAIEVLSPLYEKYPDGYTLNLRMGWLFFLNKNYSDAEKHYRKASLSSPEAFSPKLGLIRVYLANYSYEKAQSVAMEILKKDLYNYYANLYLAKALIAQNKYDAATENIQKMLLHYPTDVAFLEQLLIIYARTQSPYFDALYNDIYVLDPDNTLLKRIKR